MKYKSAKLKIVRLLITALLLCSFPSVKAYSDASYVSSFYCQFILDGAFTSDYNASVFADGETYYSEISYPFSTLLTSFTGVSFSPSVDFTYSFDPDTEYFTFTFGQNFNPNVSYNAYFYFISRPDDVTPTPTITNTPTPTPTAPATYGSGSQSCDIRWFQGNYDRGVNDYWYPSNSWSTGVRVMYPWRNGEYSSGFFYPPEGYAFDVSQFPQSYARISFGILDGLSGKYAGSFSTNEDGSVIYFYNIRVSSAYDTDHNTAFIAVVPVTPTPTLSPTPTLTPYPSSAPAAFSTYTISFVAPNGYVVGTVRPMLSVGSSYSGAISALTFSFLDGWFSYGDEVNGVKGSFTWDYSYSENFDEYLWHFSTDSWPESESINIPVYRLDGDYPEVVPDLNNVSDLFDTIGKTDPNNFSWFYDGLQAFIDINWNWAYLMLLFPLFVMLWAFFRRH